MFNQYDLASTSLVKTGISLTEMYIPLWLSSSVSTNGSTATTSGSNFVQLLTSSLGAVDPAAKLHNLSPNWSSSQKFAFEASIYTNNSGYNAYAALWDMTSGSIVSGSQISTNATTLTLLRSGSFTLTPGHTYGITLWQGSSSYDAYLTNASLVALLS